MRKTFALFILIMAVACQALAAEKRILFINSADQEIKQIHLAPTGTKTWGPNLLSKYKLHPGKKIDIAVPHDQGDCKWDLRYVVVDKLGYTIKDVDICKAVEIELFLKNGEAWANIK